MVLLCAACRAAPPPSSRVHATVDPEAVSHCIFVGLVEDDNLEDMAEKVMKLKGNAVLFSEKVDLRKESWALNKYGYPIKRIWKLVGDNEPKD